MLWTAVRNTQLNSSVVATTFTKESELHTGFILNTGDYGSMHLHKLSLNIMSGPSLSSTARRTFAWMNFKLHLDITTKIKRMNTLTTGPLYLSSYATSQKIRNQSSDHYHERSIDWNLNVITTTALTTSSPSLSDGAIGSHLCQFTHNKDIFKQTEHLPIREFYRIMPLFQKLLHIWQAEFWRGLYSSCISLMLEDKTKFDSYGDCSIIWEE